MIIPAEISATVYGPGIHFLAIPQFLWNLTLEQARYPLISLSMAGKSQTPPKRRKSYQVTEAIIDYSARPGATHLHFEDENMVYYKPDFLRIQPR